MSKLPKIIHVDEMDQHPGAVYIGRWNPGRKLGPSPLRNPYKIGKDGDRGDVVWRFQVYMMTTPVVLRSLPSIRNAPALACWCRRSDDECTHDNLCHGDPIIDALAAFTDDELIARAEKIERNEGAA